MPWDLDQIDIVEGSIAPTSWLFKDNQLIPYEYQFVDRHSGGDVKDPSAHPEFLAELYATLKKCRAQRYLALTVHPGPDFKGSVEFTIGRSNISVAPERVRTETKNSSSSITHTFLASNYSTNSSSLFTIHWQVSDTHTLEASFFFDPGYAANHYKKKCQFGKCPAPLEPEALAKMEELD